jgi:hypothetical protein
MIFLFSCFLVSNANAQDVKVKAELDTSAILIGQQTKLTLSIQYKVNTNDRIQIQWPEIQDTLRKEIDVVSQTKIDTVIPDKNDPYTFLQTKSVYITSFDSGYWAMPPFKFIVNNDTNGVYTDALLLTVSTVAVDTTQAIKDIKQPFAITYTWIDWMKDHQLLLGGILLGVLVALFIVYFIRKRARRPAPVIEKKVIVVPPHITALEKLEKLKSEKLWQEGKLKQYYIALTDIIRAYIESRFKIQAMEQTTEEILYGFRNVAIDAESKEKLRQILLLGDLVKFAKEQPLPHENEMSMDNAFDFVNGTKREEEALPPTSQEPINEA